MNTVVYPPPAKFLGWLIASPAAVLAAYFCLSTMLMFVPEYTGIQHPAYWIFGYIAVCVAWHLPSAWPRVHAVDVCFLFFVAVIAFSWARTGFTGGARAVVLLSSSAIIPWLVARFFQEPEIALFLRLIAIFGSLVSACYLVAVPFLDDASAWERVAIGQGVAYGVVGPTVGLVALMTAIYLMRERLNVAWVVLVASVVVIVHMGARGMLVSLFVTLVLGFVFIEAKWRRKAAVCLVATITGIIALLLTPPARMDHFQRLLQDVEAPQRSVDDTIAVRSQLYRQAFELFLANPLTGVGTGRFGLHTSQNMELTTPHSTLFQVLAELGLLGALPFLIMNSLLLSLAFRARRSTLPSVVAAAWVYFAVFDQISANYLSSLRYYLFSALLVVVHLHAYSKRAVLPEGIQRVAGK